VAEKGRKKGMKNKEKRNRSLISCSYKRNHSAAAGRPVTFLLFPADSLKQHSTSQGTDISLYTPDDWARKRKSPS
jgi:hypothetical protein